MNASFAATTNDWNWFHDGRRECPGPHPYPPSEQNRFFIVEMPTGEGNRMSMPALPVHGAGNDNFATTSGKPGEQAGGCGGGQPGRIRFGAGSFSQNNRKQSENKGQGWGDGGGMPPA